MKCGPHIGTGELGIVQEILARCLPPGSRVFAFGSRATGLRLKPWSDLDLAISAPSALDWRQLAALEEEFDESLLPWKVDVLDLSAISDTFRQIIEPDLWELA